MCTATPWRSRWRWLSAAGLLVAACGTAAPTAHQAYEPCNSGDTCSDGTTCFPANTLPVGQTTSGDYCSSQCSVSTDCPADPEGFDVVCVIASGTGLCYRVCTTNDTCAFGFTCVSPGGMQPYFVHRERRTRRALALLPGGLSRLEPPSGRHRQAHVDAAHPSNDAERRCGTTH